MNQEQRQRLQEYVDSPLDYSMDSLDFKLDSIKREFYRELLELSDYKPKPILHIQLPSNSSHYDVIKAECNVAQRIKDAYFILISVGSNDIVETKVLLVQDADEITIKELHQQVLHNLVDDKD